MRNYSKVWEVRWHRGVGTDWDSVRYHNEDTARDLASRVRRYAKVVEVRRVGDEPAQAV